MLKNPKMQTVGKVILVGVPICLVGGVLGTLGLEYVKRLHQRRRILNLLSELEKKISSDFSAKLIEDEDFKIFEASFEAVKYLLRDEIKMTFRADRRKQGVILNDINSGLLDWLDTIYEIASELRESADYGLSFYSVSPINDDPPRISVSYSDSSRAQPFSRKLQNVAEVLEAFCKAEPKKR